jgi:hypothetical protein
MELDIRGLDAPENRELTNAVEGKKLHRFNFLLTIKTYNQISQDGR